MKAADLLAAIDEADSLLDLAERRLWDGRVSDATKLVRAARNGLSGYVSRMAQTNSVQESSEPRPITPADKH